MKQCIYVLCLLTTGCASMNANLAPSEMRQKQYTVETKLSKDAAYDKLATWAAKAGGQIRMSDRQSGTVVVKANVECSALKLGNGWGQDQVLWFVLEMKADKQIKLDFTQLEGSAPGSWDSGRRPANQQEVDAAAKECLDPVKQSIASAL